MSAPEILSQPVLAARVERYEREIGPSRSYAERARGWDEEFDDDSRKTVAMLAGHRPEFQRAIVELMQWQHTATRARVAATMLADKRRRRRARCEAPAHRGQGSRARRGRLAPAPPVSGSDHVTDRQDPPRVRGGLLRHRPFSRSRTSSSLRLMVSSAPFVLRRSASATLK